MYLHEWLEEYLMLPLHIFNFLSCETHLQTPLKILNDALTSIGFTTFIIGFVHSCLGLSSPVNLIKDQWLSPTIFNWIPYPFALHSKEKHHSCFPMGIIIPMQIGWTIQRSTTFTLFHIRLTRSIKIGFLSYMTNKNLIFK